MRDAVVADPASRWDLEAAAAIAVLSPKYFGEMFREKIGIGFPEFVHRVRIREAIRLLSRNNFPIAEVAERVGYRSVATFRRHFGRLVGMPPRVFQDRCKP